MDNKFIENIITQLQKEVRGEFVIEAENTTDKKSTLTLWNSYVNLFVPDYGIEKGIKLYIDKGYLYYLSKFNFDMFIIEEIQINSDKQTELIICYDEGLGRVNATKTQIVSGINTINENFINTINGAIKWEIDLEPKSCITIHVKGFHLSKLRKAYEGC